MKILVANLGSTSLKWRLFDCTAEGETMLHKGGLERVTDHGAAIGECLDRLRADGALTGEGDLDAVGFKTVLAKHTTGCVRLEEPVLAEMEAMNRVAPAHNPPYIAGIRQFARRLPGKPLVGLFEDAFYQWAPEAAMRYAVPANWHAAGVRRRGYHGASHKYIAERSAELLGRPDVARRVRRLYADGPETPVETPPLRVISCHLGGSSSIAGMRDGVAVGNSLGLSPQSGLPHNNRVGDLDAMAVPFMLREGGLSLEEAQRQLCSEGGLQGISGVSNDIRDICAAAEAGNADARLALEVFVHETRRWVGAYLVALNGADALVFTAGIGENRASLRADICRDLDALGLRLDPAANDAASGEAVISAADSPVKIMIIPTNEELVVAREVHRHLAG